jgi:hypothetical protein
MLVAHRSAPAEPLRSQTHKQRFTFNPQFLREAMVGVARVPDELIQIPKDICPRWVLGQ